MSSSFNISTAPPQHPAMDYTFLRQAGIHHLERMAGQLWTDLNAHDPGITILEQLCYALTDLGYRIDYDLKDLLTDGPSEPYGSLYSPAEILTTNPVTLADLRKVVIDVTGVKNAWLEPVETVQPPLYYDAADQSLYLQGTAQRPLVPLRGIYRVLIEADGSQADLDLIGAVNQRLQASRNLGEQFEPPVILRRQPIMVTAQVEVGVIDDPDRLLAAIYHALARFISPSIRFYTLTEMLARGKRIDEIMDGPPLSRGFIDTDELERFERHQGLRGSDLIHEIMNVAGVSAVDNLTLSDGSTTDPWYLNLSQDRSRNSTPVLDIETSGFAAPTIQLMRNGVVVRSNPGQLKTYFAKLQQADRYLPLPAEQRDVRLPAGRDRQVGRYYSIQHQFPTVYGIGELGLPTSASPQRKAQAKQLKAYLLFFDQLLANYFAQLANAKELFSFSAPQAQSYFSQLIDDATLGLDDIWVNDAATRATRLQAMTEEPSGAVPDEQRKNRFLNHLLARFAEEFTDYSLHAFAQMAPGELLNTKSMFLRDYRELSAAKSRAFDYTLPSWGTENVSGLEKRISRKLGLPNYGRRDLADLRSDDVGGFYMLEPILLRPQQADLTQWTQTSEAVGWQDPILLALPQTGGQQWRRDPFSMRLCFIFPDWISRFDQDLVRRLLRDETPAHLDVQLQWLNRAEMHAFESANKEWLNSMLPQNSNTAAQSDQSQVALDTARGARDRLIDLLAIGTPYPLRDLTVTYVGMIALDQPAAILIFAAQSGVRYQLCDADGNPIADEQGHRFEATSSNGGAGDTITLQTPKIVKDISFTILAARASNAYGLPLVVPLETYLTTSISIKVGINTALPVELLASGQQVVTGHQITVAYADTIKVQVGASQGGISYVLVKAGEDTPLSAPIQGDKAEIVLELLPANTLTEDTDIQIKAYRTLEPNTSARLAVTLTVLVGPNGTVGVSVAPATPPVVAYNAPATLALAGPQGSAAYQLYERRLLPTDYVTAATPARLEITGTGVFIGAPPKIANWDDPSGVTLVGTFQQTGEQLSITSGGLTEDTLFIVLATKTANHQRVQLDRPAIVLVRPDPAPQVAAVSPLVAANTEGIVTVSGTQQGVAYQLRLDPANTPINAPGYDYRDRGVATARLEIDFVVEAPADPNAYQTLVLPAGPVAVKTTYNVLATKILSGIRVQLNGKATIDVVAPEPRP